MLPRLGGAKLIEASSFPVLQERKIKDEGVELMAELSRLAARAVRSWQCKCLGVFFKGF